MYEIQKPVTTAEQIEDILDTPTMHPSQVNKIIDHIDHNCRAWIERTTFVAIASSDANGRMDVSPKGDPAGFIKVLDPKTIAIPDRIGNKRGDTFHNILQNPAIGLMLVVPMRKEVVRINGVGEIARDDDILDMTTVNGHRPNLALIVRVQEAFFHCGKSMIRSRMWQPEHWGSIEGLPTYAEALKDMGKMDSPLEDIEARMAYNETGRLY
ncbi:MAG: MSMEG_1061 family FMN-dependent PPOX-type flavoprotein [Tateyamaria sp.]|uniref:MSMEG_1061 family FMN-dependent PPOX-type flavoprotein n=2 Tax=unclassified Tateyamaria TaxID=2645127 RepID=UPI00329FBCBB